MSLEVGLFQRSMDRWFRKELGVLEVVELLRNCRLIWPIDSDKWILTLVEIVVNEGRDRQISNLSSHRDLSLLNGLFWKQQSLFDWRSLENALVLVHLLRVTWRILLLDVNVCISLHLFPFLLLIPFLLLFFLFFLLDWTYLLACNHFRLRKILYLPNINNIWCLAIVCWHPPRILQHFFLVHLVFMVRILLHVFDGLVVWSLR